MRQLAAVILMMVGAATAAPAAVTVERFAPQGEVKQVRQATAVFSAPMVPFGDLRDVAAPFAVECAVPGTARWVDVRTWAYDFERDLPAGTRCTFALRADLKSRAGAAVTPARFAFSTGGPAITAAVPGDGSDRIDAQQVFVLQLDGEATPDSILARAGFEVAGLSERVGVRLLDGPEREAVVAGLPYWMKPTPPFVLLAARQTFPDAAAVRLVWGAGIASPSGIATAADQVLSYQTRPRFTAEVTCERENAKADCTPLTPIALRFSAPVAWETARQVRLVGDEGTSRDPIAADTPSDFVSAVEFAPPFPASTTLRLALPSDLRDDAGRALADTPTTVQTAPYPPLARFAARFGLLEAEADPALPVTIRNLEPDLRGQEVRATRERPDGWAATVRDLYARLGGSVARVERAEDVLPWLHRLAAARRDRSMFADLPAGTASRSFTLPQPDGPETMQVVGIPFDRPGLYLVELSSPRLGAALLGEDKPLFVPGGALVTNLAVHFKWARENALAWVTTLDAAAPVAGARVAVQDCSGAVLASGVTDAQGLARFTGLPAPGAAKYCPDGDRYKDFTGIDYRDHYSAAALTGLDGGLLVTAETSGDLGFVHSSWGRGLEAWRFNLPAERDDAPVLAHTILDRALFRAGDTVHMKHVLRAQTLAGFAAVEGEARPVKAIVRHLGSSETYDLPLSWDGDGLATQDWPIPPGAKLGQYEIAMANAAGREVTAGSFRVEQFRVPLMKATVQLPAEPLVAAPSAPVDLAVRYLAGGAAGELPVVLRAQVRERAAPRNAAFESFTFANGAVREGVVRQRQSEEQASDSAESTAVLSTQTLTLDAAGTARAEIGGLPAVQTPRELVAEIEYRDPNGEVQTAAATTPLWPAALLPGIAAEHWAGQRDGLDAKVAVLDTRGRPVADVAVEVDAFRHRYYSHRKRLVGGFYGYEHVEETTPLGRVCAGATDAQGLFACRAAAPADGEIILQVRVRDDAGRGAAAHSSVYVDGDDPGGFAVDAADRMDVLPEKREYAPGETARLQVRMPFQRATALVTVEREGIAEARVLQIGGGEPRVEVPVLGPYAPNTFISVLAVRGRVADTQPTAMVDLGKPAFKLGLAEIRVGWRAHALSVDVQADRPTYRVRDTAVVRVAVRDGDGAPPPPGSEVALVAVDEGLLELAPNPSWDLLEAMMGRRGYDVRTATAQLEVIGKRHYGRKALPAGGGGGRQATRELFDTLLLWSGRVPLDAQGHATVEVPLNDSLTAFRIVAVATAGLGRFGSGATEIRTTQELMLLSGLPPLVRHGDRFPAQFTLRNTTDRPLEVQVSLTVESPATDAAPGSLEGAAPSAPVASGGAASIQQAPTGRRPPGETPPQQVLAPQALTLAPGESRVVEWPVIVPADGDQLRYTVQAVAGGVADRLAVTQQVREAVPVRTLQATLLRADQPLRIPVARPADAFPSRGGLVVAAAASLAGTAGGVADYLRRYPYTCLEQQTSIRVGLDDQAGWTTLAAALPSYLDGDGLLKFFPTLSHGSEVLTAYVVSITAAAGWEIPAATRDRLIAGLRGFVEGSIRRESPLGAPDLTLRKLAALDALTRLGAGDPAMLGSISVEPNLWPTSAVLDWWSILQRLPTLPDRAARLAAVEQIVRARLNLQGTTMGFSDEAGDGLWWLMASADQNAVRLLLHTVEFGLWKDDAARLLHGALGRQRRGHWDTTLANAWGVLALRRFAAAFEATPVSGVTALRLGTASEELAWAPTPGGPARFAWPAAPATLTVEQRGAGAPWITVTSRAAIPLGAPLSSGYRISKTVTPLDPHQVGRLSRGDRLRVRVDVEAQSDMTWVVLDDPIPPGASHLGTGLARDSQLANGGSSDVAAPDFVERRFDAYRGYFQFLPKGRTSVEYDVRLNQSGRFDLPPTRAEALYAPEMFGESPNKAVEVAP